MTVLRLCSVFEPADAVRLECGFDPIGGMQNSAASLTRELDRLGVAQTVVTSRLGGPPGTCGYGARSRVVRVGLPVRRFRQFWAALAVPAVLRARPELVHVHQGEDLAVLPLGVAAASYFRCPLVVTLHMCLSRNLRGTGLRTSVLRGLGGAVEAAALRRADEVIALTARTAGQFDRPVTVIPSGVADRPAAAPSARLAGIAGPRVVYLGRLAAQKDVPTLVRAFGRLRCPASLVVVGDGPDRGAVDRAIAALPAERRDRVHRLGFVRHGETASILAAADVLVLPSVYEEMGSVLAEALQAGLPVVASRVGGIPDVVQDGVTGLLVPPRDVDGFAAAIDRLLADPELHARMSAASTERSARYRWPDLAARVLEVYRSASARRLSAASDSAVRSTV